MMRSATRLAALTLSLAALGACAGDDARAGNGAEWSTSFSSAGDTIVAHTTGTLPATGTHQLTEVWRIGDAEGLDSTITFGRLNAFAVHSDNSVAVFDESGPALRLYDANGAFLRALGRKGAGPGEYTRANGMAFLPDGRLAFWDPPTSRVTIYGTDGSNTAWDPPTTGVFLNDALSPAEGYAFVVQESIRDDPSDDGEVGEPRTAYFFYDSTGQIIDTVQVPRPVNQPKPLIIANANFMMVYGVPFMPSPASTVLSDGRVASGFGDRYLIEITHGSKPLRIERDASPVPVESAEAAEERARAEHVMRSADSKWTWDGPDIPSTKPLFGSFMASADGRLWVQVSAPSERIPEDEREQPRPTAPDGPPPAPIRTWRAPTWFDVYEQDGTLLGRIALPKGSTFLGARGDLVWGVTRDELDVPYLTQWRVTPGWRSPAGQ